MILTGRQIDHERSLGRLVIEPFLPERLEPNSYGFTLGDTVMTYADTVLDPRSEPRILEEVISADGYEFLPGRIYLASTAERMGSDNYAATLHARLSTSLLGVWIQYSAPLGHAGAIIPWTLEIKVERPVRLYPGMLIGKLAFWKMHGPAQTYDGKYTGSQGAMASRIWTETSAPGQHAPLLVSEEVLV
ncbi:deoxycytidine deaminase [Paenarthrobacter sp. NPDC056912]|uniref:dCTP deaminase n=1 Tax=Paenarthrobacter sp. NPDC056912 TaxID=3345965 RepID=UPI00366D7593